jgi:hypothetical protein
MGNDVTCVHCGQLLKDEDEISIAQHIDHDRCFSFLRLKIKIWKLENKNLKEENEDFKHKVWALESHNTMLETANMQLSTSLMALKKTLKEKGD